MDFISDRYQVRTHINEKIQEKIAREIQQVPVETRARILEIVNRQIARALISPGELVGIISGTSLGGNQTQMNLNAFHHTGITNSSVVSGIPKFTELIEVTKASKFINSFIYTNCESLEELQAFNFIYATFKTFILIIDKIDEDREPWFKAYTVLFNKKTFRNYYRIHLKLSELYKHNMRAEKICEILSAGDYNCIFSPFDDVICIENTFSDLSEIEFVTMIESVYISGIEGIKDVAFKQEEDKWMIETIGNNSNECFKLPFVIYAKTFSNNLWEIYELFGIESVYYFLVNEFAGILTETNICNILTMVSLMTYNGYPTPISRYGMNTEQYGLCAMASFEESFDQIIRAAVFGSKEEIRSISSSIVCAGVPCIGTGSVTLLQK